MHLPTFYLLSIWGREVTATETPGSQDWARGDSFALTPAIHSFSRVHLFLPANGQTLPATSTHTHTHTPAPRPHTQPASSSLPITVFRRSRPTRTPLSGLSGPAPSRTASRPSGSLSNHHLMSVLRFPPLPFLPPDVSGSPCSSSEAPGLASISPVSGPATGSWIPGRDGEPVQGWRCAVSLRTRGRRGPGCPPSGQTAGAWTRARVSAQGPVPCAVPHLGRWPWDLLTRPWHPRLFPPLLSPPEHR